MEKDHLTYIYAGAVIRIWLNNYVIIHVQVGLSEQHYDYKLPVMMDFLWFVKLLAYPTQFGSIKNNNNKYM